VIEQALNAHLKANIVLTALVGTAVFPIVGGRDQEMPAITYAVDLDHDFDLDGSVALERYQIRVSAVAQQYELASGIADAVRDSLNIQNAMLDTVLIQLCKFDAQTPAYSDELDAYIITINFTLTA
jgi:hypothetical protein